MVVYGKMAGKGRLAQVWHGQHEQNIICSHSFSPKAAQTRHYFFIFTYSSTYIQGQDMERQALQAAWMIMMALKAFGGPYKPHNEAYDVWEAAWARLEEEATKKGAKCAKWPNVQIGAFLQIGYMCKLGQGRELAICAKNFMLARSHACKVD
ncbi:uncharacterized protein LOC132626725 [Lycium barbarum]|uniref:uncharacterized protein LOC132626725 n=1 Tax=Lycium barbarum TaxID=112863 RepID=UPI00293E43E9|nr:uncharacterized protein LOC132626725 [Lycium barbarum]